ncbi:hypothetical protein PGT21_036509 [Puccinia graminis f. sp. tritici]|uniref:F-box domain-containing protein n=1 Tax=Puccinia graminis f. sp. tritici TaxID=56615 RepID=A0A5B0R8W1_PUCGR|nr:hypothetical protein PGT21_036509 [Puccinia graminis f. sp. tritici]KAA1121465.1 hypothetical protein PGTUg99_027727 [Puccinia graminis f. sp. tritici]
MASPQHLRKPRYQALGRSSAVNGQKTLLDLPIEMMLEIITWLPRSREKARRKSKQISPRKALRLTSRFLAVALEPFLLDAVSISCASSARDFLKWCTECVAQNRDPPVRRLSISNVGHPSLGITNPQLVFYNVFEGILSVISPCLHQLKVEFYNCFEFSDKIVHSFGRATRLWALHLQINGQPPRLNPVPQVPMRDASANLDLHDPYPFLASLRALPSLSELDLNNCLDYCMSLDTNPDSNLLPCVQHLSINIDSHSTSLPSHPHKFLLELCRVFSESLLILEIKGSRYDSSKLLPVLGATRRRLEALYISDVALAQKCQELKFPRLRTFMLDDSRYLTRDEFRSPFFEQISTLVLRRWKGTDVPLEIPVEAFPNLNRVVLTYTSHITLDIASLLKECQGACIDLLATPKSVNLKEIWAVDAAEARHCSIHKHIGQIPKV